MPSPVPTDPVSRRRLYLSLAQKRVRPGSGSRLELLQSRTWRSPVFPLSSVISTPFVVIGGVATRLYAPERMTDDLDVLISVDDAPLFYEELTQAGASHIGPLAIPGNSWRLPNGTLLDVLESDAPWTQDAFSDPAVAPDGLPVIRLPYLILLKMAAGRGTDFADLTRMLGGASDEALAEVRAAVTTYTPDDLDDLESIIQLGQLEYVLGIKP
jgi:hypothetical protein